MMPVVSKFGSYVDIGSAIGIGQYRKSNIGISAKSHIGTPLLDVYAVAERATPVLLNDLLVHVSYKMQQIKTSRILMLRIKGRLQWKNDFGLF